METDTVRNIFAAIRKHYKGRKYICLYTMCVAAAGVLFADVAVAQAAQAQVQQLDLGFILRTLLGVLIAIIAYYTRGVEKRVELLEHELKQVNSSIGMIREQIYRDYESKAETLRRWEHLEASLQAIRSRLDYMARPQHRRTDDEDGEGASNRRNR